VTIVHKEHYHNLDAALKEGWRMLSAGVVNRHSSFHHANIATVTEDGRPNNRVMILRGADPALRILRFHTDRRSHKFAELYKNPHICALVYDPIEKIQLRLDGKVSLHTDGAIADDAWERSRAMSRACYSIMPSPGTSIEAGDDFKVIGLNFQHEDTETGQEGRENFAALIIHVQKMEWLYLAAAGNRRAAFSWDEAGRVSGQWLAP
jgi:pyridoxamine 5'-phosphate oxidase